ncbi:tannase/feruloyl esterase family alpha/beta hydrolase [Tersicoccus sp. Bi-70]|uniref:tannase/feruloyl esterase family alpha/beta hydrolase n=1 Tax=Tersicoccus sp. Bi-70 TaxID=1897634 RepID=UPI0013014025|nr:tannase/feruloyl esterase family alpha/beta hydrolase [Tersicoccus sp. Bi-70]
MTESGGQCRVLGDIHPVDPAAPPIKFEVNLPGNWNGRALQMGGGGYDGTLVTGLGNYALQPDGQPTPLQQGFVTLGSDGGHEGAGFDSSFGLNDEALANYGTQSIKKTHDVAVALVRKAFKRSPQRFYFIGFSQGGHEAINAAGLYPKDYDGVVAGTPSYNVTMMHAGIGGVYAKALYGNGGAGWLNPAKTNLLVSAVSAACDGLDGVKDGVIANTKGCLDTFDVTTLRCPGGADTGDTCLSDAQIGAANDIASTHNLGFPIAGNSLVPAAPIYYGATYSVFTLGTVKQPSVPASGKEAFQYAVYNAIVTNIVTRNPNYDTTKFNALDWSSRLQEVAKQLDSTNVDLSAFAKKGGKMLLTTGLADDGISPENTTAFYQRQVDAFGQRTLDGFMKYYTMPGFSHGFGAFNARYDALPTLMNWVEKGKAPSRLTMVDANKATAGRTRPLCEYPRWVKYTGGDASKASSFTCTATN